MKLLSRDFSFFEKALMLFLGLVLLALVYYQFVDQPVRSGLAKAASEKSALEVELAAVNAKIAQLDAMQSEMDSLSSGGLMSRMPSYNNNSGVNQLLNDILGHLGYTMTFSNVTRDGDQIRRNVSLQFSAPDYDTVASVLKELTESEYRCLIGDVRVSVANGRDLTDNTISVALTATFYETMVGGTADAGLPESTQDVTY